MNVAFAHSGEIHEAAQGASLLSSWSLDPVFLPVLLLAFLYFRGLRSYRAGGGRRFPRWRPPLFTAGVILTGLLLLSPLDALADYSFTWHMLQHQGLMLVAVPLVLLGAPFIPVIRGIPKGLRRAAFVPLAKNKLVRGFFIHATRPLLALLVMQGLVFFWHQPFIYDLALRKPWAHYLEHFLFVFPAALFWWNIVTPYPFPSRLNYWFRIILLYASALFSNTLGALITFSDGVLYRYGEQTEFWGMTMQEEQQLGALLMWVGGAMMHLAAATVVFYVYAARERRKEPPRALYITADLTPGTSQ